MRLSSTNTAVAVAAAALVGVIVTWMPRRSPASGDLPAPAPPAVAVLDPATHLGDALDERRLALVAKSRRKAEVIVDLTAGRIDLPAAVRQVLAIESEHPELWAQMQRLLQHTDPGDSIEECVARNLARRSVEFASGDQGFRHAVATRLDHELDRYLTSLQSAERVGAVQ